MFEAKHIGAPEENNNIKSRGQVENKKKNKVRKESFVLIPGWAVCDFGLKGNELLIYSIIFGFSQEENQTFRGSLRYLMDWTTLSKPAVITILKTLVKKGLIKKIERFENNVKFCEYYATRLRGGGDDGRGGDGEVPKTGKEDDQSSDDQPGKETLPETSSKADTCSTLTVVKKLYQGGKETLPNNIGDNIDNNYLSKKERATKSFDSLIDDYTENENLRKELKEHLKTRKIKKAALTNRAIELSLKKLDQLAVSDAEKLLIVQNAVMNGWTTFYPLKADEKRQLKVEVNSSNSSYNLDDYYNAMDTFLDPEPQVVDTNPLENVFKQCDVDYRVEQRKKQLEKEKKQKSKDKKPNTKHNPPSNCDQKKINEAVKKLRDERNTPSLLPEITWQKIAEDVKFLSEKNDAEEGGILTNVFPGDKEYIDTS